MTDSPWARRLLVRSILGAQLRLERHCLRAWRRVVHFRDITTCGDCQSRRSSGATTRADILTRRGAVAEPPPSRCGNCDRRFEQHEACTKASPERVCHYVRAHLH